MIYMAAGLIAIANIVYSYIRGHGDRNADQFFDFDPILMYDSQSPKVGKECELVLYGQVEDIQISRKRQPKYLYLGDHPLPWKQTVDDKQVFFWANGNCSLLRQRFVIL